MSLPLYVSFISLARAPRLALMTPIMITMALMSACLEPQRTVISPEPSPNTLTGGASVDLSPLPEVTPGPTALRRLTQSQYERSLKAAFGPSLVVPHVAEPDVAQSGLLSVGASSATLSARGVASLEEAALSVAQQVIEREELRARALPCALDGELEGCAREALALNGLRLWRRPLSAEELERLVGLTLQAHEALGEPLEAFGFALTALMQSPYFLFRHELGDPASAQGGAQGGAFEPYALASRLSFFLWNSPPDDELLEAARSGELATREGLKAHAERLISDERLREGLSELYSQQLKLYQLADLRKDPLQFDHFSPELLRDAREETLRLILHIALDQEGDLRELMSTRERFLSPRLAALYGVPAPTQEGFKRVTLPEESPRVGLLSHASLLSLNAHPTSSSATLRGKFVRTVLLCQEIPPPPPGVDTAIPEPSGETLTLRDRVAEHLNNPTCSGCHKLLDPIGLALENYDTIGRWRERDNGALIDASGELDGTSYDDPQSLSLVVKQHPSYSPCVVKTFARYAIGRRESAEEEALIEALTERFERAGHQLKPLLLELILSPLFMNAGAPQ